MKLKQLRDDTRGATIVEFTLTIPFFLLLTWGIAQAGLMLWTQSGVQQGVEYAARCASVNYSSYQLGLNTSCFTDPYTGHPTPSEVIADTSYTYIKQYAIDHSFGLVPAFSDFAVTPPPSVAPGVCPSNLGYMVTATHTYNLINYIFSWPISATSKYPINCS
jgi:TadE-like protein